MDKIETTLHRLPAFFAALALCAAGSLQSALAQEPATAAAPEAAPVAAEATAPAAAEPALAETAVEPAAPAAVAEPESTAPVPAAEPESATPAETAPATAESTQHVPARLRFRDREYQNRRIEEIREAARQRRENMEQWRSARRWWNNPAAEDRRQWNKTRSQWQRDRMETLRKHGEQRRPDYDYSYRYWRVYP